MPHTNPTRARSHYASMALQSATLAAIEALRDLLDAQRFVGMASDPQGTTYLRLSKSARAALDRHNEATAEMRAAILNEEAQ